MRREVSTPILALTRGSLGRFALAALCLAGSLGPLPAHATKGEPEQLIPDSLPINAERLFLSISPSGTGAVFGGRGAANTVTVTPSTWQSNNRPSAQDSRRGHAFNFPDATKPFRVDATGFVPLISEPPAGAAPHGMTVSVWYKKSGVYDGEGYYPVWSLGRAGSPDPWWLALVLKDGVPVVSLKSRNFELFSSQSVPQEVGSPRVDDGRWHHLALRVTRCTDCTDVGFGTFNGESARVSLYVDGQWRGDEVAMIPVALNRLELGDLATDKVYNQPNFVRTTSRLQSRAFIDDVFLFDAPLSDFEIVKLHEWTKVGYMAQYPMAPKDTLFAGRPDRREQQVQVGAPSVPPSDLFAVSGTPAGTGWGIRALERGAFPDGTTTFAWLRNDNLTGIPAVSLLFSTGHTQVSVTTSEAGFSALCLTGGRADGPFARDPRNRYQLLALTRLGTTATLYQDGVKILTLECPDNPTLVPTSRVGLETHASSTFLAWTGSFDAVLDAHQIDRRAASGPRLWNGTAPGATALVDLTGKDALQLEKHNSTDTLLGGLFTNDARTAANGGLAPGRPAGVFAAATGTLHPGDGTAPFTISFTLANKTPTPTAANPWQAFEPFRRVLARRVFVQRGFFTSYLENTSVAHQCVYENPQAGLFGIQKSCVLDVVVGVGPGKAGRRFHVDWNPPGDGPHHLAIAYGETRIIPAPTWWADQNPQRRLEPIVVVDGRMLNQRTLGTYNPIRDMGEVPGLPASASSLPTRWVFGPGSDGGFARILAAASITPLPAQPTFADLNTLVSRDPLAAAWVLEMTDMRVYGHVHRDIEALGLDRTARCAEAGRGVVAGTGPFHGNYCGGCIGANFLIAGATVATRECRPQFTYNDECAGSNECEGGAACWKGSCLTTVQSVCDEQCGELGRVCVNEGASKRCGGCKARLTPNAGNQATADSWDLACSWQPSKKGGEVCGSDDECVSGWCVGARSGNVDAYVDSHRSTRESQLRTNDPILCDAVWGCDKTLITYAPGVYSQPWSEPASCAYEPDVAGAICAKELARVETNEEVRTPNGESRRAQRCLTGFDGQCEAFAEKRWLVLDPQTCRAALNQAVQIHAGNCNRWYQAVPAGCRTRDYSRVEDNDRRKAMLHTDEITFDLQVLKRAILGEDSVFQSSDYARLIKAGVGPRLIEFAAAPHAEKIAMRVKYGWFLPLATCATNERSPGLLSAYDIASGNVIACEPKLQPNGATCPPAGSAGAGRPAWQFCESSFCDERGTNTCTDGGRQRQEAEGEGGNKKREGKEAVKFGVVRVDDTRIELVKDPATDMQERTPGYTANLSQVHVPCVLGTQFPPKFELLNISAFIDKSQPTCSDSKFDLRVMGWTLNPPPPEPVVGSCTGVSSVGAGSKICNEVGTCTKPSLENLKNILNWAKLAALGIPPLPTFEYCLPIEDAGTRLPKKTKTFLAGPVPITISIGLTLDPCITASFGFADQGGGVLATSQTGLPQLEVTPSLAIGVEAKAGVGAEEDNPIPAPAPGGAAAAAAAKAAGAKAGGGDTIGASAGVKLALTIIELRFPLRWGMALSEVQRNGAVVPGLFKLEMFSSISMGLEYLSGWMGLYVTLSVGVFGIDWTLKLFGWTGVNVETTLWRGGFPVHTIDFRAALAAALAGEQVPPKAACDGNQCER